MKEATKTPYSFIICRNFNSRFREGSDHLIPTRLQFFLISIHASAKEATVNYSTYGYSYSISIHASAKEATSFGHLPGISIHASTKEATLLYLPGRQPAENFNPRFHEGSDANTEFSSILSINFNPRFHEGSDSAI